MPLNMSPTRPMSPHATKTMSAIAKQTSSAPWRPVRSRAASGMRASCCVTVRYAVQRNAAPSAMLICAYADAISPRYDSQYVKTKPSMKASRPPNDPQSSQMARVASMHATASSVDWSTSRSSARVMVYMTGCETWRRPASSRYVTISPVAPIIFPLM